MQPGAWQTAAAVTVSVIAASVLLETSPKLGGALVAILVLLLLSRGLKTGNIHGLT